MGSLKRQAAESSERLEIKNCMPLWCKAHLEVEMPKTFHFRSGSSFHEEVCAVGARQSRKYESTKHFCFGPSSVVVKLRHGKSAPRCDAKHISKSNCTRHCRLRALLEVEVFKKYTPLWRKAHLTSWRPQNTVFEAIIRCRARAHLCGAKHMSKSKCEEHTTFGPLVVD